MALVADASAPEGWLRYGKGGWVLASALLIDRPSSFEGELDPVLPVAFLPDALELGTREDRVVISKQSRFGAAEVGAREVIAGGWRLPRGLAALFQRGVRDLKAPPPTSVEGGPVRLAPDCIGDPVGWGRWMRCRQRFGPVRIGLR